jgi:hypothetical protein
MTNVVLSRIAPGLFRLRHDADRKFKKFGTTYLYVLKVNVNLYALFHRS